MAEIKHYYKCFGCGRRHVGKIAAQQCCCVVQEIFACSTCGDEFPTEAKARQHVEEKDAAAKESLEWNGTNDTNQVVDQAQHDFMMGL